MATIKEFIASASAGFIAVAEQRNADVGSLTSSVNAANAKADAAAAAALGAEQSASGKVNPDLDNAVFPATNFTSTFQDNLI